MPEAIAYAFHQRFATLDADWRTFPHDYLLYASTGAFQLDVDDATWALPPHRAALIAAGTPIRVRLIAPATCASVLYMPGVLPAFAFHCRVFALPTLAREMLQHAMRWGPERDPNDAAADHFFLALANVCLELAAVPDAVWLPRVRSRELSRAVEYALARLDAPLHVPDVARAAGVSERTLARRFADEAGMPWREFLLRARMIRAMELLAGTAQALAEVAYSTGFESVSAFSTAFRRFSGETPASYRRRVAGAPLAQGMGDRR